MAVFSGPAAPGAASSGAAALDVRVLPAPGQPGASRWRPRATPGRSWSSAPQRRRQVARAAPGAAADGRWAASPSAPDERTLRSARAARASTSILESWRTGDPPPRGVLAHLRGPRAGPERAAASDDGPKAPRRTAQRLAILTDIVKTANSILEPRKVIELIMGKIQQLIPSEAWSHPDGGRGEAGADLRAGAGREGQGRVRASGSRSARGSRAGWRRRASPPSSTTPRRTRASRGAFDTKTQFQTRSILCAPAHLARAHHRRGARSSTSSGGKFTQADLELLLTLVEPCAIAIENAILFQRTEQLTITDDLTQLFNSRYLNLYIGREIKRCKRHGIPLSVIFLDLDGFKSVNDAHGHLAGSRTLTEVGGILVEAVRESRHPGPLRRRRVRGGAAGDARRRAPSSSPSASAAPSRATSSCGTQGWRRASPPPSASPPIPTTPSPRRASSRRPTRPCTGSRSGTRTASRWRSSCMAVRTDD